MTRQEVEFQKLLNVISINELDADLALDHLACLIDLAFDFGHLDATMRALKVGEVISNLTPGQAAILNYYLLNAWANRMRFERVAGQDEWKWEQPEIEKQVIHLRRALGSDAFPELEPPCVNIP